VKTILECKNLCFSYPGKDVLKGFGCEIFPGERVSLLGQSGCGKTSLLRIFAGLEKPVSGDVLLRGEVVASSNQFVPASDRNIGFVFQNFALFEKISVEKNIYYGCKTKAHKEEAEKLIGLMKLGEHLQKKPFQLSGGERQKVALARSLAVKPDIIFLDEPFSSIDPGQTEFLIKEIKELFANLGVTALMVTHSPDESRLFSDRVINL